MKPLHFSKINQLYLFVSLYFMTGSVALSLGHISMNLFILLNGILLVGIPVVYLTLCYKGEQTICEFLRLNPVTKRTVYLSVLLPIAAYPMVMGCNALVIMLMPDIPEDMNNAVLIGSIGILFQVIGVGLLPGFFEELLFRGILIKGSENKGRHFAIIYTAFLFALLHLNPYNFVGPFLLGILFGHMLYATNSVIPGMIAHATNNLMAVIFMALANVTDNAKVSSAKEEIISLKDLSIFTLIVDGILLIGALYLSFRMTQKIYQLLKEENIAGELIIGEGNRKYEKAFLTRKEKTSFLYIVPWLFLFVYLIFTI